MKFSKRVFRFTAVALSALIIVASVPLISLWNAFAASGDQPIITLDFENSVVVNNYSNITSGRPATLAQSGSLATKEFYKNEKRYTGGNYWARSSWAAITSDANPKNTDKSYDWAGNNEYMKLTYCYQIIDLAGVERSATTSDSYKKSANPSNYKDYAYHPGFLIPSTNDTYKCSNSSDLRSFSGDEGKEYTIKLDIALVEDDGRKVEFYCKSIATDASDTAKALSNFMSTPSVENGDILICSTAGTGDKKLTEQSKDSYTFKTYEFKYKATAGKTPFIMMVTNDGQTIDAPATKKNFACSYVDNIKIYDTENYLKSAMPDGSVLNIKYNDGEKLSEIKPDVAGYVDDGKWYDDFDCTSVTADIYPQNNKIYYKKWSKYFVLDFESKYQIAGYSGPLYRDPFVSTGWGYYYTKASLNARRQLEDNYAIEMTYINSNQYMSSTYSFTANNYASCPYIDLFDPATETTFTGSPNFTYKISFDYKFTGTLPEEDVSFYLYLTKGSASTNDVSTAAGPNKTTSTVVGKFDVNAVTGGSGTSSVVSFVAQAGYRPQIVMVTNDGVKVDENPSEYFSAWIDNVKVEEVFPEGKSLVTVNFDTDGGSDMIGFRAIKGDPIGTLAAPTKSGYLFDCWYDIEDASKKEVSASYILNKNIKLKAKWVSASASNYTNGNFTTFTSERYPNVLENYDDLDVTSLYSEGVNDSTMTAGCRYIKSNCPNGMESAMLLTSSETAASNAKEGIGAFALLNKDGSKFAIKSGKIYKLSFDCMPLGQVDAHSYIKVSYGSYTADTIDASAAKSVEKIPVHGASVKTESHSLYFKASQDGFVFFTLGLRQNFDSAGKQHCVLIDNVKLETVSSGVYSVTYKNADGSSITTKPVGFSHSVQYGKPGDKIRAFGITPADVNSLIEGFYTDSACKKICNDYDVVTKSNRTIYVKYKKVSFGTASDFTEPIVLDFENSDDFRLDYMYRNSNLMYWACTEEKNTNEYIGDDEENAYSGKGYMRIYDYKYAYGTTPGHAFTLYDKSNPSGVMLLSPKTSYRISAMVKYEDDAKLPNLKLWWLDPSTMKYTRMSDLVMVTKLDDVEGYTEISAIITNSKDILRGVAIGAVYLAEQNVYIDDVKVEQINPCTITFDVDGADPIDPITVLPYSDISSDSPGMAYKMGYEFIDWYLDKEFTKPFDFLSDTVTGDTVLYAKFELEPEEEFEEEPEEEPDEDTTDDTDDVTEQEETDEAGFGNKLNLNKPNEKPKINATLETVTTGGLPVWLLVLIIAGGAVLAAGITVLTVCLIRRKKS